MTTTNDSSSTNESGPHQYTVPLNDTQEREGPTLLQTIKAYQFHGVTPTGERWSIPRAHTTHEQDHATSTDLFLSNRLLFVKKKRKIDLSNIFLSVDVPEVQMLTFGLKISIRFYLEIHSSASMTTDSTDKSRSDSNKLEGPMVVAINGDFELQNTDDYTAKRQLGGTNESSKKSSENREQTSHSQLTIAPSPRKESKDDDKTPRTALPQQSTSLLSRPKSSSSSLGSTGKSIGKTSTRPMR